MPGQASRTSGPPGLSPMPGIYRYIRPNVLIGRLGLGQVGHRHVGTSLTLELLQRIGRNLFIHLPAAQDVYRHVDRMLHRLLVGFVLPGDIETHPVRLGSSGRRAARP